MANKHISDIKSAVNTVAVANFKIAQANQTPAADTVTGLLEKCMDQICLDQMYTDKLTALDGDEKEFGAYIEEYAMGLTVPKAAQALTDGQGYTIPYCKVDIQGSFTSWKLPEYIVATSTSLSKYKASMRNAEAFGAFVSNTLKSMTDSYNQTRYEEKKALLQWAAANVAQAKTGVSKPTDTATGEAYLKAVKNAIEEASFARDITVGSTTYTLGAAESFTLYVTKEMKASLDIDTLAGAFNAEKLSLPCEVVVVDVANFGTGVHSLLVDNRAIKLFPNRNDVAEDINGYNDYVTYSRHVIDTPFVSKFATIVKFSA